MESPNILGSYTKNTLILLTVKFNCGDDCGLHGVGRDLDGREVDLHGLGHRRGYDVLHRDRLVAGVEQQEFDGGGRAVGGQQAEIDRLLQK